MVWEAGERNGQWLVSYVGDGGPPPRFVIAANECLTRVLSVFGTRLPGCVPVIGSRDDAERVVGMAVDWLNGVNDHYDIDAFVSSFSDACVDAIDMIPAMRETAELPEEMAEPQGKAGVWGKKRLSNKSDS